MQEDKLKNDYKTAKNAANNHYSFNSEECKVIILHARRRKMVKMNKGSAFIRGRMVME